MAAGENVVDSDELGQTLVHWAMAEDSKCGEKLLSYILDKGAEPDSENWYGKKPKDLAVSPRKLFSKMQFVFFQSLHPYFGKMAGRGTNVSTSAK